MHNLTFKLIIVIAHVKKLNFLMYQDRAEFLIPFPAHFLEKLRKVQE